MIFMPWLFDDIETIKYMFSHFRFKDKCVKMWARCIICPIMQASGQLSMAKWILLL
jgi:hypothetical protein